MDRTDDSISAFLEAACVPLKDSHTSGTLVEARAILASRPEVASQNVYTAAVLGDEAGVRGFLAQDPASATTKGGPRGWDALTYLCFSRFLRLDPDRSAGFLRSAEALLDAGADPKTGWFETGHQPSPVWESALYGAAGVAHHEGLTRLLLARGADPNDEETPYHAAESYDLGVLRALVESGLLNDTSLTTLLLRKADWHHLEGLRYLLEHGADPNRMTVWGRTALHNAVIRDNSLATIETLLDHGADQGLACNSGHGRHAPPRTGVALAARRGRVDLLGLFEKRGIPVELSGLDRVIAACARGDTATAHSLTGAEPALAHALRAEGGVLLAEFAGNGNTNGLRSLLELGLPVGERYLHGDGYFGIAPNSTALHVAAWRAQHGCVSLLIERGASVSATDGWGRTPLALAVKACVDSYWSHRRSPDSVRALLAAGASVAGVTYPSGYGEVDELLQSHGAARA